MQQIHLDRNNLYAIRYGNDDPTNDIRVIRFCLSVPEEHYVQDGFDRALIRRSTENFLPDKVRLNQHYRGVQGARLGSSYDALLAYIC